MVMGMDEFLKGQHLDGCSKDNYSCCGFDHKEIWKFVMVL